MKGDRKYLVVVVSLAVIALVFGLVGTVAPMSESVSPQQSSSPGSVTHFTNPPTYDSGWVNTTDKAGKSFALIHNLNTTNASVTVMGKQDLSQAEHQLFYGATFAPLWNKTYGGSGNERAFCVIQTSDGGYALAGDIFSGPNNYDFWLVRTDPAGNALWNRTYDSSEIDWAESVIQTGDGGYALAGASFDGWWLVKTDQFGNAQWNKTFAVARAQAAHSVIQTSDGGYALVGYRDPNDIGLIKTDSLGNALWNKTWGGAYMDDAHSVVQTSDGGFTIGGYTGSFGAEASNLWLIRTDSDGNTQWNKVYEITGDEAANSMIQTSDGGYALVGSPHGFLLKTDVSGNMEWSTKFEGTGLEDAYSIVEASTGGYAIAGVYGGYEDFSFVKTNSTGHLQWNRTYGGPGNDWARSVVQSADGGYALAGIYANEIGPTDFWLIKTDASGNTQFVEQGLSIGLSMTYFTDSAISFYRGSADTFWNYVRVRIWIVEEPTWQYGDINQDGVVDAKDLYILSRNYGQTFSLVSLGGIVAIASVRTYKKRKQQNS